MEVSGEEISDGIFRVELTLNEKEIDELLSQMGDDDAAESESILRKDYCCTCPGGNPNETERHNIRASNSFSAKLKCLKKCKGPFSVGKGKCP